MHIAEFDGIEKSLKYIKKVLALSGPQSYTMQVASQSDQHRISFQPSDPAVLEGLNTEKDLKNLKKLLTDSRFDDNINKLIHTNESARTLKTS